MKRFLTFMRKGNSVLRMTERERFVPRVIRDMRPEVRVAWLAATAKQQRTRQQRAERRSV